MSGAWEIRAAKQVLLGVLHTDIVPMKWALMLRNLQLPGRVQVIAGQPFCMARNTLCQVALQEGYQYIMFVDSDVLLPPDAVHRLMSHKLPIVSGLYHRRSPPAGVPVMMKPVGNWVVNYPANSLIEVDVVGAGCLLIHRTVLERMPPHRPGKPWFDWRVDMLGHIPREEALSEDFAFCFPKGTWVMGPKVQPIEKVKVGDRVVSHKGTVKAVRVLETGCRFYSGDMVRLQADYVGGVECTPGHKFWIKSLRKTGTVFQRTWENRCIVYGPIGETKTATIHHGKWLSSWEESKNIREGDWLYIPKVPIKNQEDIKAFHLSHYISKKALTKFPDGKLGYARTRKDALRLNSKVHVTPDLCRLLGYFIAEGYAPGKGKMGNKHYVAFCFSALEKDYIQDCQSLLMKCFGAKSTLFHRKGPKGGGTVVISSSKILGRLFSAICGHGSRNKHLPRFWFRLNQECLTELIKGYWNGDGHYSEQNDRFSMNTVSEQLARELQAALLRLGVLCGVKSRPNVNGVPIHVVSVPCALTERFSKIVQYYDLTKSDRKRIRRFRETKKHFLVRVRKAETFQWSGAVYNLTVSTTQSYTANAIGVHNCVQAKRHLGISTIVDTGLICPHVGLAEATFGRMDPCVA